MLKPTLTLNLFVEPNGTIAVKKSKDAPTKVKKAPWGYKKDGTPKKRPGRH